LAHYKTDDVFEATRPLYRIPLNDNIVLFSPKTFSVINANQNIQYLLDTCSLPATFNQMMYLFNKLQPCRKEELSSILERLYNSGFIKLNGVHHPSALLKSASPDSSTVTNAPGSASVHLTDRCNLKCLYCYNEETRRKIRKELNQTEWDCILQDLVSSGVKSITVTGGEPVLRKDLFPLFQKIRENGIVTGIITNGTLISQDIAAIIADSFNSVTISLDSHIEKFNDANRGKGSYSRAMKAISILENEHIPYSINAVLTKYTISHFVEMRKFFRRYKYIKGGVTPILYESMGPNDTLVSSYSQIDRYYHLLYQDILHDDSLASVASNIKQGLILLRNGCGTGRSECAIGPDGSLYPCRALYYDKFNAGNLLDISFMELWRDSSVLKTVRHADTNRKSICKDSECDLFHYCLGGCFGHTYASTGKLVPWASSYDCYQIKQHTRQKLIASILAAEKGESVLEKM